MDELLYRNISKFVPQPVGQIQLILIRIESLG